MIRFRKKLEVEALPEPRVARIEASLFERLRSATGMAPVYLAGNAKRAPWRPAIALVFVGAGAAIIGAAVVRVRVDPAPKTAALPTGTAASSHVSAAPTGSRVEMAGAAIDMSPGSEARVSGDDSQGVLVVLEHGTVDCEVAPRAGRPPFVVRAGDVTVKVVGTHFRVALLGAETTVQVDHGIVEAMAPDERLLLRPGDQWTWPHASAVASSGPKPAVTLAAVPQVPSVPRRETTKAPSEMERYNEAATFEGHRSKEALELYRNLARGSDAWAANALFAEGRLEADMGSQAEARLLLEDYLVRYPQGPNANDARHLLDRLR